MSDKIKKSFQIPDTYSNQRLDQALAKLLPLYSRTQIKDWIESGAILVNKQSVKPKIKLKGGEQIDVHANVKEPPQYIAQDIKLNIVYEDESLLIINKPVGLVVHPGAGNMENTLLNALLHHCKQLNNLPRAGILHRLDKNTSGLLLVAKTQQSLRQLSIQLKKRLIKREYQAIVQGKLISGGTISAPIARHPIDRKKMTVTEDGKEAVTHYRVMEKYRNHTRLRVQLETGRTHQIRVHMAHIYHPIVGDPTYGKRLLLSKKMPSELIDTLRNFKRQALHAFALEFTHPEKNELVKFEIDLPDDIKNLIAELKKDYKKNS